MSHFEIVDLLELASRQRDFPRVLELPHETVGECCIDPAASDAFHMLAGHGRLAANTDLLEPALQSAGLTDAELDAWFERPTHVVVDVGLSVYDSRVDVSDTYIWFLLNRIGSGADADPSGFAVPAARRVNGSPYHLEPLAMPITPATYAANVALTYGAQLPTDC